MLRTLPFCAAGTKSVSCELQRAFGAIKCFLKHFNGVQYESGFVGARQSACVIRQQENGKAWSYLSLQLSAVCTAFACPTTNMTVQAAVKRAPSQKREGALSGNDGKNYLASSAVSWAIISSSLVGMTQTVTLESSAEMIRSSPRSLFFSGSSLTPRNSRPWQIRSRM